MPTTGDTAILRYGSDNKWHWFFLTPSASSMLGFDSSAVAVTPAVSGFATSAQGSKADSALQNADAFATSAQGALASTALQSQAGLILSADTGWTQNNTAGDKTAALSSYSNGLNSTIITALNLAAANSGTVLGAALDVLVIVVKKLAALETALAAGKLPNA